MAIPYEISHVYSLVRQAGRFAVWPKALVEGADPALLDPYSAVCSQLWAVRETAAAVAVKWNRDSRHFDLRHEIMSKKLANSLVGGQTHKGALRREAPFCDISFLFHAGLYEFAMTGGILLEFAEIPDAIHELFAMAGGPLPLSGGNQAFRSALTRGRRWAAVEGRVSMVFRDRDVEILAGPNTLETLFLAAHTECYRPY